MVRLVNKLAAGQDGVNAGLFCSFLSGAVCPSNYDAGCISYSFFMMQSLAIFMNNFLFLIAAILEDNIFLKNSMKNCHALRYY